MGYTGRGLVGVSREGVRVLEMGFGGRGWVLVGGGEGFGDGGKGGGRRGGKAREVVGWGWIHLTSFQLLRGKEQ